MTDRTKYPVKTSLELTQDQADFVAKVAAHLTVLTGKPARRGVSKKAVHRMMVDHAMVCPIFLAFVSMDENSSIDSQGL